VLQGESPATIHDEDVGQDAILPYIAADFHRTAQVTFQNPYSSLNPRKTVRDIVSVPAHPHHPLVN
jgi:ABC-type dipeptide/oligopeptide/nickel transport system ATPase subunit